jgi:hypothetical protein
MSMRSLSLSDEEESFLMLQRSTEGLLMKKEVSMWKFGTP